MTLIVSISVIVMSPVVNQRMNHKYMAKTEGRLFTHIGNESHNEGTILNAMILPSLH